jgi:hypothetical protein
VCDPAISPLRDGLREELQCTDDRWVSAAPSRTWTTIRRRGDGLTSSRLSTPGIDSGTASPGTIVTPTPAATNASAV